RQVLGAAGWTVQDCYWFIGGWGRPLVWLGQLTWPHIFRRFKCPICLKYKIVSSDKMDLHLVMCLPKPRITYNENELSKDAGKCAICLEEIQQGDTQEQLPYLCIHLKGCTDEWFEEILP
uniref:RING-type E3 ubiquitin transferase n=1 Tax=Equus asinus asinus TaxID=83772 RepID=A0A8C4LWT3_EQUAS